MKEETKKQEQREEYNSEFFLNNLREDILKSIDDDPKLDKFFAAKYGVQNVMDIDFPDLKDKDISDFNFDKVRGNTRLMEGLITTHKESSLFLDKVQKFQF